MSVVPRFFFPLPKPIIDRDPGDEDPPIRFNIERRPGFFRDPVKREALPAQPSKETTAMPTPKTAEDAIKDGTQIEAFKKIGEALDGLPKESQIRVIAAVSILLDVGAQVRERIDRQPGYSLSFERGR